MPLKTNRIKFLFSGLLCLYGNLKKPAVCGQYLGHDGGTLHFLHCYFIYIKLNASSIITQQLKTAVMFIVCFQRHNANDVAYEQMPGCPLCTI